MVSWDDGQEGVYWICCHALNTSMEVAVLMAIASGAVALLIACVVITSLVGGFDLHIVSIGAETESVVLSGYTIRNAKEERATYKSDPWL
jgi:hypothetical protein